MKYKRIPVITEMIVNALSTSQDCDDEYCSNVDIDFILEIELNNII